MASGLEEYGKNYLTGYQEVTGPHSLFTEEDYSGFSGYSMNDTDYNDSTVSPSEEEFPLDVVIPIAVVMSIVSLITSLGNALVIVAVRTDRRLRTVSNYFIFSLAVADLLIGLLVMPLSIIYFVNEFTWPLGRMVCETWLTLDYVTCTASIFSLFILSLDRYWSISSPLKYMKKRTSRRALIMISLAWFLSCMWIIPVWGWHHITRGGHRLVPENDCDTEFNGDIIFKVLTAIFNFYIPLSAMLFVYGKIFHEIKSRSKMCVGQRSTGNTHYSIKNSANMIPIPVAVDVCAAASSNREDEGDEQNPSWIPDFDSISTSKDTSQEIADPSESSPNNHPARRIKKGDVDFQLKNISHLTLATMGLAGIVGPSIAGNLTPSSGQRILKRRKVSKNNNTLAIKQVQRILSDDEYDAPAGGVVPTIKEPTISSSSGPNEAQIECEHIQMKEMNGKSALNPGDSLRCPERAPNGTLKRRISFTVDPTASKEELEPLRRKSSSDKDKGSSSPKYRGVSRHKSDSSSPTHLLPEDNANAGNTSPTRTTSKTELKNGGLSAKFAFARFSIRRGKTSEFIRDRMRRFSLNKERKAAKQLGIIVGCFITCWLPYFISFLIIAYCPTCVHGYVHYSLIWLGYLNSTMNPFIYPLCNSNFRKAFKKLLGLSACCPSSKTKQQNKSVYKRPRCK